MKYVRQCPFLILLTITVTAAAALYYNGYRYSDTGGLLALAAQAMRDAGDAVSGETVVSAQGEASSAVPVQTAEVQTAGTGISDAQAADMGTSDTQEADAETSGTQTAPSWGDNPAQGEPAQKEPAQEEPKEIRYELRQVDDDYFNDAVFIGDSRTVGLCQYGNMPQATFYAETGFTIYKFFDAKIVPIPDSKEKMTVEEALSQNQFKKVYLMVGINEMGRGTTEQFAEEYTKVVERIAELQPDALIILEAIMYVGKEKSESDPIFNNANIALRNEAISRLADNQRIFYFDMNPTVLDEEGNLRKEYSFDGVHLRGQYMQIWKDYLYANGIVEAE